MFPDIYPAIVWSRSLYIRECEEITLKLKTNIQDINLHFLNHFTPGKAIETTKPQGPS